MIYTFTGTINRVAAVNPVHDRSRLRACMTLGRDWTGGHRGFPHDALFDKNLYPDIDMSAIVMKLTAFGVIGCHEFL